MTTEPLLTKEQTCVYLSISAPTLDRWMRAGKMPVLRIGKKVRFSKEKLDELMAQKNNQV
jgi:excisionase family DNA binding protein